jgi:hypothetical protein
MCRLRILVLAAGAALALAALGWGSATVAKLRVRPPAVPPGGTLTITGSGFRPRVRVTISVRQSFGRTTSKLGRVQATAKGGFRLSRTISRSSNAGRYVVIACQRGCRTKATARFFVPKTRAP